MTWKYKTNERTGKKEWVWKVKTGTSCIRPGVRFFVNSFVDENGEYYWAVGDADDLSYTQTNFARCDSYKKAKLLAKRLAEWDEKFGRGKEDRKKARRIKKLKDKV
jgi:hypothetical protein